MAWLAAAQRKVLIQLGRLSLGALPVKGTVVKLSTNLCGNENISEKPKIVILLLAHFGDFLVSLRALQRIRTAFPGSAITLISASWNVEWARQTNFFESIIVFDFFTRLRRDWHGPNREIYDRFAALPLGAYDIAIDLRHDADTRPCLYRVDAKFRAGYAARVEAGYPHLDLMLPAVESVRLSNEGEFSLHAELRIDLLASAVVSAFPQTGRQPIRYTIWSISEERQFSIVRLRFYL